MLAAGVAHAASSGADGSVRPSPKGWDQWQPQTDSSDTRLDESLISVWEPEITLGDLLLRVSEQSGVGLTGVSELTAMRVSVFVENRRVGGLMSALAHLFEGYWAFERGRAPSERAYCLVGHDRFTDLFEAWCEEHSRGLRRAEAAQRRPEREERMALYRSALTLSPAELLERHEKDDPWLCADLLDPGVRPMVEYVLSLGGEKGERLLSEGSVVLRLAGLRPQLRDHLGRWARGEWGAPGAQLAGAQVDYLPRFSTPEERWANGHVELVWQDRVLQWYLNVPDTARFHGAAIEMPRGDTLWSARQSIAELGQREWTRADEEQVREETREWWRAHGGSDPGWGGDVRYSPVVPAPNEVDARLQTRVALDAARGRKLAVADVLAEAARQSGLGVVAPFLPVDEVALRLPEERPPEKDVAAASAGDAEAPADTLTLGEILSEIRRERGGLFTWNFLGEYLVAADAEHRLIEASRLTPDVIATWEKLLQDGACLSLDELADLLAGMNEGQVLKLWGRFATTKLVELPLNTLRLYALLGRGEREQIATPEGMRLADLAPAQRRMFELEARWTHPWVVPDDLSNAVLRRVPRKLSTGEEGVSFLIEYHFSESPNDRDVLFTSPLRVTLSGAGRAQSGEGPLPPDEGLPVAPE